MAQAQVKFIDPDFSIDMAIESEDGLIPDLVAFWRANPSYGQIPRTVMVPTIVGKDAEGNDESREIPRVVYDPASDEEVVRRFFGQLYMREVAAMKAWKAEREIAAVRAKHAVPGFTTVS